jgi:hypothetical protein
MYSVKDEVMVSNEQILTVRSWEFNNNDSCCCYSIFVLNYRLQSEHEPREGSPYHLNDNNKSINTIQIITKK